MSGLTFVGLFCEDFLFVNGVAFPHVWFEVCHRAFTSYFKHVSYFFLVYCR